ncbi:helix-turn-helix transcriptional regulator [Streptomyces sp. CB01881]|uniref:helix-turn-helix transcriptional regulator n=1 Tax=Streptomyces sp. CB01881 TaxID=2078691 RepID=UPI000CDC6D99|nr:helix-turn-helix transcriptional regulator [Streptomyces sp. CB01881]AUY51852.1 DNA-binding protein [Streptomyces sp. CB01881]TYC71280.1 XRE family transcriptional regulator [Streptomyces sp. CB01881]
MSLTTAPATTAPVRAVPAPDEARRHELAAFLRSRRERIAPEQVGLPMTGRRRTPGLRREEVAQLAAVGVTWYTWLEQGRDIQVSAQVLDAVARALLLDPAERGHLFVLAGTEDPAPVRECLTVTPAIRLVLEQMSPMPAAVVNTRYDVLAHNPSYAHLVGNLDELPFEDRNLMWMAFTPSRFREVLVDHENERDGMVARFRSGMADHSAEPAWKALLARLRKASPDFEAAWQRHDVMLPGNGLKRFMVPGVGLLHCDYTNFWLGPRPSARLIAYTPRDEETRERMELMAGGLQGGAQGGA